AAVGSPSQGSAPPASGRPGLAPSSPPLSRPGGGFPGSRTGGGPLAAHTRHGGGLRPGQPSSPTPGLEPRAGQAPAPSGSAGSRFQPLERKDYMSSAGIRTTAPRSSGPVAPPAGPPRRPVEESGADSGRRETPRGGGRPLPGVAAPVMPSSRAGGPPRPSPSPPAPKTQRPEKPMTKGPILGLMKAGQTRALPAPRRPPGPGP